MFLPHLFDLGTKVVEQRKRLASAMVVLMANIIPIGAKRDALQTHGHLCIGVARMT